LALKYHIVIPVVSAVLLLLVLANLAAATFMNPGFLPRGMVWFRIFSIFPQSINV
jgi:16S rRNA C1402 (ribose-2'-O) methylase RsmI